MRHIFLIDSLDRLTIKKDSSLFTALTFQELGETVYLLFEEDFYCSNLGHPYFEVFTFAGTQKKDDFYLESFLPDQKTGLSLERKDILHMRLDPPFDKRYLRYLWMLRNVQKQVGLRIINSPEGLLLYNEKLYSYTLPKALPSFMGSSPHGFKKFVEHLQKQKITEVILKPMDAYQGDGVEKMSLDRGDLMNCFAQKVTFAGGPIIAQPFSPLVYQGEIRSIYFCGRELGSFLKIPPEGDFLTTIARGAHYQKALLTSSQKRMCKEVSKDLENKGILWIAFDILGESIQEVNITCPGLLVEASRVCRANLAEQIWDIARTDLF